MPPTRPAASEPRTLLGGLSPAQFLAEYWQKRPLLIRQALPGYHVPLSPEELAGLACEPEVESRLVLERGGARPWQLEHGPFPESRFASLPATHWTLLVQEVDRHVPSLAGLLDAFDFIPHWRIDDVMVSYAPPQGSVGPHCDQYDVFLLQGLGRRHWHIDTRAAACAETADALLPDTELRILAQFEAEQDWVLEPGDMLYLPPGVAHHGIALDDCLTLSVGFRAPSAGELLSHFCDALLAGQAAAPGRIERRYTDPDVTPTAHPGAIAPEALAQVRALMRSLLDDEETLAQWFGRYVTEHQRGQAAGEPEAGYETGHEGAVLADDISALRARLAAGERLQREPESRYAYRQGPDTSAEIWLYVDGAAYALPASELALAQTLCDRRYDLAPAPATVQGWELLATLIRHGKLHADPDWAAD